MKSILISISPNAESDDVLLAARTLLMPWKWNDNKYTNELEKLFLSKMGIKGKAFAVNSGRSGLYLILKALGIGKGDEVVVQAFTCVAVPNSAIWNGAKPVYADIDDTFNIDPKSLEKKITSKTKAIVVQHTFGIPADYEKIKEIADKNGIIVIEDCAHALGSTFNGKKLGTLGDLSFFSFGRDKCISSVFGGMILAKDDHLAKIIGKLHNDLPQPGKVWIIQQLLHPILMSFVKPLYNLGFGGITLGKALMILAQKIKLLSFPVYQVEKSCKQPSVFPSKMPGALSILAFNQLKKLDRFVSHRKTIAKIYLNNLEKSAFVLPPESREISYLRFPILTDKVGDILHKFKSKGILLGDWYNKAVVPVNGNCSEYVKGSCPRAEMFTGKIINLPTYTGLTENDANDISYTLNE